MTTDEITPLNLDPILIPSLIIPVQTEGAVGGVNYGMLTSHENGLLVQIPAYLNMQEGDSIEVFWGDETSPVASERILDEHVGNPFSLFIRANRIPDGVDDVWYVITRAGSGNKESSTPIGILVRTAFPGGTDPEPDLPGHQRLLPPQPETDFIDEEAAKNGVKVTVQAYPNMRRFDRITLSWGGELLPHEVTQDEVDAGSLEILVSETTILAAGDSDELVLVYRVRDEVHNTSSDWSLRTIIQVEVGQGLFNAPMIENPDPNADPYDVIDLDLLGDDDLIVSVYAEPEGKLQIDDVVRLTWIGTTAQGETITVEPPEKTVARIPINLEFPIPNADVRALGRGRAVASHRVTRDGSDAGASKRTFATFLGEEQRLPKPTVPDAVNGVLDPTLAETTVIVPGDALESGDYVRLVWLGTRANGSPLLHEDERSVSGNGAGKPMTFSIPATAIAPLDGGTLSVYYSVEKSPDLKLESEREHLTVGEARDQLPPPFTRPASEDGVLDPEDLPAYLQIVIPPWPGMHDEQTVHVFWRASIGLDYYDFIPISAPLVGREVVFHLDRTHVEANLGADIELSYRVESPGETDQVSEIAAFAIGARQGVGDGPLRIMGARRLTSSWAVKGSSRMLTALHDETLAPMVAEWRYEGDEDWTTSTTWIDTKPWLKLYTRNNTEAWESRPANIVGNGTYYTYNTANAAFVAMRDEVMSGPTRVVDMVGWGLPQYGGTLGIMANLQSVVEISSSLSAFAARQTDGSVGCWGTLSGFRTPATVSGTFDLVRSNTHAFVGRRPNGELFSWGHRNYGVPVPDHVLQHKDYVELFGTVGAFAGLRASGHVVAWGNPDMGGQLRQGQETLDDIVEIASNQSAFAAIREHAGGRSVIAWGSTYFGGMVPDDIARLTNVRSICSGVQNAFCILLDSGEVKAWPSNTEGGQVPSDIAGLSNVVEVTGNFYAFCARLSDNRVVAWGNSTKGGRLTNEVSGKSNIVQVSSGTAAFAALCSDGKVVAWGAKEAGGSTASVAGQLVDVRAVYGNANAFTALTRDGRVVTWGIPGGGGNSSGVQPQLAGKVTARRLLPVDEARALFGDTSSDAQ
ncbi:RCC1 domain-containing protein [Pseudomonas japonica]|uniref:Alpha-tubulin suppressor n=1 Tax=Pseudomonas japonica TaxID=256466 RepID=A0A239G4Y1_9PSED|nr:hypothetical protein [Pseudomonas japonica]SNS63094.1 hypothetical protein SAMN05444352_111108 [Pseudomonas japonica]